MGLFEVLNFSLSGDPGLNVKTDVLRLTDVVYEVADLSWKLQIVSTFSF